MSDDVEIFLAHYGVKGMRWGVRKERRQARREASAQKFEAKASAYHREIEALMKEPASNWLKQRVVNTQVKGLTKARDTATRDAEARRQGKMTSRQKKVAIGAAMAATILAAAGTYAMVESGEANRLVMKGKALFDGQGTPTFKKNPVLAKKDLDLDELQSLVVKKVNPKYGAVGTKTNCRRATFAYEMRRRGYDVAATRTNSSSGQNIAGLYNATTPGAKKRETTASLALKIARDRQLKESGANVQTPFADLLSSGGGSRGKVSIPKSLSEGGTSERSYAPSIFKALASQPDGARGELGVSWRIGGGHSLAWEIVRGKPVLIDAQNGRIYRNVEDFLKVGEGIGKAAFTRLDNVELNEDFLMRWMKNANA